MFAISFSLRFCTITQIKPLTQFLPIREERVEE